MNDKMNTTICPLCGGCYDRTKVTCSGCSLSRHCRVICCPHCGYRTVDDSGIRDFFDRIRSKFIWVKQKILKMKS